MEGGGGGGASGQVAFDNEEIVSGFVDCCLPGVFNISNRLLSIKCSLKGSVLLLLLMSSLEEFVVVAPINV